MTTRLDLIVRQGETWSLGYTKRDSAGAAVDLTGYTARMAIRDRVGGTLQAYLSTGADADGGTIALGDAAGTVVLAMTATESAELAASTVDSEDAMFNYGIKLAEPIVVFVYDLELISAAGAVTRELEGRVEVQRQVTT